MTELATATAPALAERRGSGLLVVPLGSTEQHGPHLPLGTDTLVAEALGRRLVAMRGDALLAPVIAYGSSGEHAGFAGTVSIGQEALELVLVELCRSASASFAATVLVSGHGGNAVPVARAVRRLTEEGRRVVALSPTLPGDAHAGRTETSLVLALAPGLVRLERAEPGATEPLADLLPALRAGGVAAVSANGVLGDPSGASAEEGDALLESAAAALSEELEAFLASGRAP